MFNGRERDHDTGRQRGAIFYWLGSETTHKQQGLCALAVRDSDPDRYPHIRVPQFEEPTLFMGIAFVLFHRLYCACADIVPHRIVQGSGSGVFALHGATARCAMLIELREVQLRSQGAYLFCSTSLNEFSHWPACGRCRNECGWFTKLGPVDPCYMLQMHWESKVVRTVVDIVRVPNR